MPPVLLGRAGLILCGGHSKRMGRPKATLSFAGDTMLGHIARTLAEVACPVVAVAAVGQPLPPLPIGVEVACDDEPDQGPLAGLAAGLTALAGRADAAFVTACDVPFLRPAFVARLFDLLGAASVCVPDVDGRRHPLTAVYRVDLLPTVRDLLARGQRRLLDLLDAVPTRRATADELRSADPDLRSLVNINTPEDYASAQRQVDGPGGTA